MQSELRNKTLVAANLAKQNGFENTHAALIEMVKEITCLSGDLGALLQDSKEAPR